MGNSVIWFILVDNLPCRSGCRIPPLDEQSIRASLKFLLPSLIYTVNNNIYLAGLLLVPPPIWVILCSFRTVVTAFIYKFILKRDVSNLQFLGSFLIMGSIVVAKLGTDKKKIDKVQGCKQAQSPSDLRTVFVIGNIHPRCHSRPKTLSL